MEVMWKELALNVHLQGSYNKSFDSQVKKQCFIENNDLTNKTAHNNRIEYKRIK